MYLTDIAMITGETSRSSAYLQALVRNQLLPSYVLVLANPSHSVLPGQLEETKITSTKSQAPETDECWSESHFNMNEPVMSTLEINNIPHEISVINNINDPAVVGIIRHRPEPVFIYSGYGGVLLKKTIFETGKRFLHIHGGYLPDYKGSTANYYSLIEESTLAASSLFLNEEIDNGPVLFRRKFPPPEDKRSIDHIYDAAARAKVLVETLKSYIEHGKWRFETEIKTEGETYYIIHPVLKHIAILGNKSINL